MDTFPFPSKESSFLPPVQRGITGPSCDLPAQSACGIEHIYPFLCRSFPEFVVHSGGIFSQLSHISQDGDPASLCPCQNRKRGPHRRGVGIVAVINQSQPAQMQEMSPAGNGAGRLHPRLDLIQIKPQALSDSCSCQRVVDIVLTGNGNDRLKIPFGCNEGG